MEEFKKWLKENKLSIRKFSAKIDYADNHLSLCLMGKRKMGPKLAKQIEKMTKGAIKAEKILADNAIKHKKFRETLLKKKELKIEENTKQC